MTSAARLGEALGLARVPSKELVGILSGVLPLSRCEHFWSPITSENPAARVGEDPRLSAVLAAYAAVCRRADYARRRGRDLEPVEGRQAPAEGGCMAAGAPL